MYENPYFGNPYLQQNQQRYGTPYQQPVQQMQAQQQPVYNQMQQVPQQGFNTTNVALMQGQNALQAQLADCCCQNREAISQVRFDMAQDTCALQNTMNTNTRDIIESQNAGTRAILDYLCQDKIATLQAENNDLRLAASQDRQNALLTTAMTAQTNQIINAVNPTPIPAYQVPNPNVYYGCGNGCGC